MAFTVNDRVIDSDKAVRSIVNDTVYFADGSWCNVRTGQVHNGGPGYINLDTDVSPDRVTLGPTRYQADRLILSRLKADVTVEVADVSGFEVTVTGPDDLARAVRCNVATGTGETGSVLRIDEDSTAARPASLSTSNMRVGSLRFGSFFSQTTIQSGPSVQVLVKVPPGTSVNVDGDSGDVVIGDTHGPLFVEARSGNVTAGQVSSADLTTLASGDIEVAAVSGPVTAKTRASGDINILGGSATSLDANVSASGEIEVVRVNGPVEAEINGSGDLTVVFGYHPRLTATNNGSGELTIDGTAGTANLKLNGSGDLKVNIVEGEIQKRRRGSGDLIIERQL